MGGRRLLLGNFFASLMRREEWGDCTYDYRGIPHMYLHLFTQSELTRELRRAGFRVRELIPLDTQRRHALPRPWLLGRLRANGWIVVAE